MKNDKTGAVPQLPSFVRDLNFWDDMPQITSPFEVPPESHDTVDSTGSQDSGQLSQQSSRQSLSPLQSVLTLPSTRASAIRLDLQPTTSATRKFDMAMARLPPEHLASMFIDHGRYHGDPLAFDVGEEGEPGYARAMLAAFDHLRETVDKPIDAEEFRTLHMLATDRVQTEPNADLSLDLSIRRTDKRRLISGEFAIHGGMQQYGMCLEKVTAAAWHELYHEGLVYITPGMLFMLDEVFDKNELHIPVDLRQTIDRAQTSEADAFLSELRVQRGRHLVHVGPFEGRFNFSKFADRATRRVTEYCEKYHADMATAQTPKDKVRAMVRLCRALEIGHFFTDGNQRTTAFLLLNKLLMQNEMSPTILPNPTALDGYKSADELVGEVEAGQEIFARMCETPKDEEPAP